GGAPRGRRVSDQRADADEPGEGREPARRSGNGADGAGNPGPVSRGGAGGSSVARGVRCRRLAGTVRRGVAADVPPGIALPEAGRTPARARPSEPLLREGRGAGGRPSLAAACPDPWSARSSPVGAVRNRRGSSRGSLRDRRRSRGVDRRGEADSVSADGLFSVSSVRRARRTGEIPPTRLRRGGRAHTRGDRLRVPARALASRR